MLRSGRWLVISGCISAAMLGGCDGPTPGDGSATQQAAEAVPANRLSGLYLRMTSYFDGRNFSFQEEHHYFTPDGRVYYGVPKGGLEHFDWDTAEPNRVGTYEITGDKITLTWKGDRKPTTMTFARKADGNIELDGLFASKRGGFPADTKLDGTYSWAVAAGGGTGAFVSAARSYTFKPDGTFTRSASASASLQTADTSAASQTSNEASGRYTLGGNTLTLTHADGTVERHTVYPFEDTEGQMQISVDGALMTRSR